MRRILVVFLKELIDNLRDRRSVSAAVLFTLVGPIMIASMLTLVGRVEREKSEEVVVLPTIGAERAPGLVEQLEHRRIQVVSTELDVEGLREAVRAGDHEVGLIVDESYAKDFREARPALVQIVADPSQNSARSTVHRVRQAVVAHGMTVGRLRLLARGIDPSTADAIEVDLVDVSTPQSLAATLLGMLPFFLILSIFLGGYYLVVDATAGELERGSLEPLLVNPVARSELIAGKLLAGVCFSAVGLVVAAFGFWLVPLVVRVEAIGRFRLDASVMVNVVLLLLPMVLFATAVGMVIATLCRSFKQAQTTLSLVMMLPVAPGLLLAVAPFKTQTWMFCVPMLSEQILLRGLIRGDPMVPAHAALAVVSTLAASVVAAAIATRLFTGERPFGIRSATAKTDPEGRR